jgi:phospholipid/cholesterol/gamma-HCH transport system permease protein
MAGAVELNFYSDSGAAVALCGVWVLHEKNARPDGCAAEVLRSKAVKNVRLLADGLKSWDSSLVNFVIRFREICESGGVAVSIDDLPVGAQKLVSLASAKSVQAQTPQKVAVKKHSSVEICQNFLFFLLAIFKNFAVFFGEICGGVLKLCAGKMQLRGQDFLVILQEVGVRALPIVSLISFLVGLIIAFISILQLAKFGASIYVADLVGIAMMREMGCIMTGVIMSGRTGAAFAATIGTMVVNDEVDALKTTGLSGVNFLVIPRVLALTLMMPLLCIFSSFIGIVGGMFAAICTTNLTVAQYWVQVANAVFINDFAVGIVKGCFFGILVSAIGCQKGLQCGRSAEDVGLSTTTAVVNGITAIILTDALFAVVFSAFGV